MPRKTAPPAIILVDDEEQILYSYRVMLRQTGIGPVETVADSRRLLPLLAERPAGVIVLDLQMPFLSGKELLERITADYPGLPVLMVTAANDLETAVACMRAGAFDYLTKPVDPTRFVTSVRQALEVSALRQEVASLRSAGQPVPDDLAAFAAIRTCSPRMQHLFSYLGGIAGTSQPVLITGETGTGKELVARAIHTLSGRGGDFVAVNLAGLDDQMFSDTLFGHRRGAFTGADQHRDGMLVRAGGGTLLLDEIGDLQHSSQVKLLRLLQEGEFHPLGSDTPQISTARIVVATNRDLSTLIARGEFRKDLYYRLCAHQVELPPLRERPEDLPLLLEQFLAEAAATFGKPVPTLPAELPVYLAAYDFPGNVRELRALVFDAMARHQGGVLSLAHFKSAIGKEAPTAADNSCPACVPGLDLANRFPRLREMEQLLIAEALRRANGNQGAAATLLGISRQALNKRLQHLQ